MTVVRCSLTPSGSLATQAIAYFFSLVGDRGLTVNSVSVVSGATVVDIDPAGIDLVDVESNVDVIITQITPIGVLTRSRATV